MSRGPFRRYQDGEERRRYLVPVVLTRQEIETYRRWAKRISPDWDERNWLSSALTQGLETAGEGASDEDRWEEKKEATE